MGIETGIGISSAFPRFQLTFSLFVHVPYIFILDGKENKSMWIFTEQRLIFSVELRLWFVNWFYWALDLKRNTLVNFTES